jgi:exodeoxyribonuclease VII small subunit
MEGMKFEEALVRLEEIVRMLERGEMGLEESLKAFEEGIMLSRFCMRVLSEAERKVEMLISDESGDMRIIPFETEE